MRQTRLSSPAQGGDIWWFLSPMSSHCVLLSALTYALSPTPLNHASHRYIADMLKGPNFTYEELNGHSHFFDPFPELIDVCNAKIEADSDGNDLKDKKDSSSDDLS